MTPAKLGFAGFEHGQTDDLIGSACWTRTNDPLINSQLLYQLS